MNDNCMRSILATRFKWKRVFRLFSADFAPSTLFPPQRQRRLKSSLTQLEVGKSENYLELIVFNCSIVLKTLKQE